MKLKMIIICMIVLNLVLILKIFLVNINNLKSDNSKNISVNSYQRTLYESYLTNGKSIPNLTFKNLLNEKQNLKTILGDCKSLLLIYSDVSCNPCVDSLITGCNQLAEKSKDKYKVVGISHSQNMNYLRRFARINETKFPFLLDETGSMMKMLYLRALPVVFMLDKNHVIVNSFFIDPNVKEINSTFFNAASVFLNGN